MTRLAALVLLLASGRALAFPCPGSAAWPQPCPAGTVRVITGTYCDCKIIMPPATPAPAPTVAVTATPTPTPQPPTPTPTPTPGALTPTATPAPSAPPTATPTPGPWPTINPGKTTILVWCAQPMTNCPPGGWRAQWEFQMPVNVQVVTPTP